MGPIGWARYGNPGYEVSSLGDRRFSALFATLSDCRTIEEAYQLDVKGYRCISNFWKSGKGKPSLYTAADLWPQYLALWQQWAYENPHLMDDLRHKADGKILTDRFATTPISQARALYTLCDSSTPT